MGFKEYLEEKTGSGLVPGSFTSQRKEKTGHSAPNSDVNLYDAVDKAINEFWKSIGESYGVSEIDGYPLAAQQTSQMNHRFSEAAKEFVKELFDGIHFNYGKKIKVG